MFSLELPTAAFQDLDRVRPPLPTPEFLPPRLEVPPRPHPEALDDFPRGQYLWRICLALAVKELYLQQDSSSLYTSAELFKACGSRTLDLWQVGLQCEDLVTLSYDCFA